MSLREELVKIAYKSFGEMYCLERSQCATIVDSLLPTIVERCAQIAEEHYPIKYKATNTITGIRAAVITIARTIRESIELQDMSGVHDDH